MRRGYGREERGRRELGEGKREGSARLAFRDEISCEETMKL